MSRIGHHVLSVRLVRRRQLAVSNRELLPESRVTFVWSPDERLWRSENADFAALAERSGPRPGQFAAIARLSDGPIHALALRVAGVETDSRAALQARLDAAALFVPPRDWVCVTCRSHFATPARRCPHSPDRRRPCAACVEWDRRWRGPCPAHAAAMPPASLYRTSRAWSAISSRERRATHWVFGRVGAGEWSATADPDENDLPIRIDTPGLLGRFGR